MKLAKKKARKEHICKKCGGIIKIGEEYYGENPKKVIFAGIHSEKYCLNCYEKENNNRRLC